MTMNPPESHPAAPSPSAIATPPSAPTGAGGLAIAALIVGIIAFLSGLLPVGGLIAGVAAVVLGILALRKGQSKGLSLTGLILGALGAIASLIATIVLVAGLTAASQLGDVDIVTGGSSEGAQEEPAAPTEDEEAPAGDAGSRSNPLSLGTTISSAEWDVTVNSFTMDATSDILAENSFNDDPEAGMVYSMLNSTVVYTGEDSDYAASVSYALVSDTGEVFASWETFVVVPDSFGLDELYGGGTATGNVAIAVPEDFSGTLRVTPGLFSDDVFFAVP